MLGLAALVLLVGAAWFDWNTHDPGVVLLALDGVPAHRHEPLVHRRAAGPHHPARDAGARARGCWRPARTSCSAQLSPKQVVALRFASDDELGELLARAVREQMTPDAIKRAVKQWRPDYLRT